MAKVNKAARGKHRWIGFQFLEGSVSRISCEQFLSTILSENSWKLFDFKVIDGVQKGIIKTPLEQYKKVLSLINSEPSLETLTSSGKIRLVRQRLRLE
jgi:hypothetical protein